MTMLIDIHLLDTTTGERRIYADNYDWMSHSGNRQAADGSVDYMFGMGNYSCDCNRHLFFGRAIGVEPQDFECGDDRFVVEKIVERGTDRVIYKDEPWSEKAMRLGSRTFPAR